MGSGDLAIYARRGQRATDAVVAAADLLRNGGLRKEWAERTRRPLLGELGDGALLGG